MLKRTNVFLDTASLKALAKIGRGKGGLKVAQVIRMAISEFVRRETTAAVALPKKRERSKPRSRAKERRPR